jgi:hypothetical protein
MRSAVALLGEQEVRTIIEEQGKIEVGVEQGRAGQGEPVNNQSISQRVGLGW